MSRAYYNEIDPYCAQWLRNLIAAGHIAPGDVDERSIEDVRPDDLRGYTQCHFFAGIGIWSLALRLAGWADDRSVWTGSCPCQPFSAAGQGAGFADERHLWPAFHHLIRVGRPAKVLGEQVASKDADPWIDLVQDDMEAMGYAFGAVPFPSAGVGAPHIRDRLYWVADAGSARQLPGAQRGIHRGQESAGARHGESERHSATGRLANANGGHASAKGLQRGREQRQQPQDGGARGLADAEISGRGEERSHAGRRATGDGAQGVAAGSLHGSGANGLADATSEGRRPERADINSADCTEEIRAGQAQPGRCSAVNNPGPTNGYWRDADWLRCRDGKWRPVEARVQQVVDGVALRVGPMCPLLETKIKEVTNEAACRLQTEAGEILRTLREAIDAPDIFDGRGGIFSIHEAQILLAYLLEYAGQEGQQQNPVNGTGARSCAQRDVRMLWRQRALGNPSCQRELARQPLRELANTLRLLSSAVARFASEAGYQNFYKDAAASFPLGEILYPDSMGELRPKNRAARLRAYGNAINAEAARVFIETVMG